MPLIVPINGSFISWAGSWRFSGKIAPTPAHSGLHQIEHSCASAIRRRR